MMFTFRIVVFYITTIGDHVWHGSNTTTAPQMYIQAATESDAESMLRMSGLVPEVGDVWSHGNTKVTQVDLNITEAQDVAVVPF